MMRFGTSKFGYSFFDHVYESESFDYCIFSSKKSIELMEENIPAFERRLLMDATFKVCPDSEFTQLLIIYAEYAQEVDEFCCLIE